MDISQYLQHAREIIKGCQWCFVNTLWADEIHSRVVMVLAIEDDLTIRFVTGERTRKASEMRRTRRIGLSFLNPGDRGYVSMSGTPSLSKASSLKQRLWQDTLFNWFPDGPQSPDLVAVSCRPEWMELWCYTRGIAPEPKGLNSIKLWRQGESWDVTETSPFGKIEA